VVADVDVVGTAMIDIIILGGADLMVTALPMGTVVILTVVILTQLQSLLQRSNLLLNKANKV
jgi:hypothetical protein